MTILNCSLVAGAVGVFIAQLDLPIDFRRQPTPQPATKLPPLTFALSTASQPIPITFPHFSGLDGLALELNEDPEGFAFNFSNINSKFASLIAPRPAGFLPGINQATKSEGNEITLEMNTSEGQQLCKLQCGINGPWTNTSTGHQGWTTAEFGKQLHKIRGDINLYQYRSKIPESGLRVTITTQLDQSSNEQTITIIRKK